jgi:hypothetical protein
MIFIDIKHHYHIHFIITIITIFTIIYIITGITTVIATMICRRPLIPQTPRSGRGSRNGKRPGSKSCMLGWPDRRSWWTLVDTQPSQTSPRPENSCWKTVTSCWLRRDSCQITTRYTCRRIRPTRRLLAQCMYCMHCCAAGNS